VFEKMFAQKQMYFFSDDELAKLNTAPTDAATIANFSKIDEFVVKAKEATKQAKAEAVEVETTVEVKDSAKLALRKQIQAELNRIGCTLGRVDGKIGPASKRALSRFNKLNKSSNGVQSFFNDKSQLEKLKKISSGFCPPIVVAKKEIIVEKDVIYYRGTSLCRGLALVMEGRTEQFLKLRKINANSYRSERGYIAASTILTKRSNGYYYGIGPKTDGVRYKHKLKIDENKKTLKGRSTSFTNSMDIMVNILSLGAGICKYRFNEVEPW